PGGCGSGYAGRWAPPSGSARPGSRSPRVTGWLAPRAGNRRVDGPSTRVGRRCYRGATWGEGRWRRPGLSRGSEHPMSPESPGSMGLEGARWPDDDWPEDDPDDDDPDDDDWPDDEADDAPGLPGPPWPPGPPGAARPGAAGPPRQGGIRPLTVAAVAVVALAIGGVAALIARGASPSSPSTAQSPGSSQQGGVPGSGGGFPGGGPVGQL